MTTLIFPRKLLLSSALLGLFSLAAGAALAGEIPIYQAGTYGAGDYYVSNSITGTAGTAALIFDGGGEDVNLDLRNFEVQSTNAPVISVTNVKILRIISHGLGKLERTDNGGPAIQVSGFFNAQRRTRFRLDNVAVFGGSNSVQLDNGLKFVSHNNTYQGYTQRGVYIFGTQTGSVVDVEIENSNFFSESVNGSNQDRAIWAEKLRGFRIVDNNIATGNGGMLVLDSASGLIAGNTVTGTSTSSTGVGILVQDSADVTVERNSVAQFPLEGIFFFGGGTSNINVVSDNRVTGNGGYGIKFSPSGSIFYGGNISRDNGGSTPCTVPGVATCGMPNFCNESTTSVTQGDNWVPGPPPC